MLTGTFVVTVVVEGELRAPEPGEPGDPGEPGFNEADDGGLDRLVLVEPEKASLKLGFCLPDKLDFPSTSLSSGSFTGGREGTSLVISLLALFFFFLNSKKHLISEQNVSTVKIIRLHRISNDCFSRKIPSSANSC